MNRRHLCKIGLAGMGTVALYKPLMAMEYYAKTTEKKKWCILYGTKCNSTKEYAGFINKGMGEIADVVDIAKTTPKVGDYEYFIIGGWISGGNVMPKSIPSFVTSNKDALKSKIMGLFTVCGNGGNPVGDTQIKNYLTNKLVKDSGVTDKPAKLFNGRSDPACNGMSMSYDLVSEDAGVDFGKSILATALKTIRQELPQQFELNQNYPNPFNPITTIRYSLPVSTNVVLSINALNGRRMATLVSGLQAAGNYEVTWDGSKLAPGYYLYQLEAGNFRQTRTARRASH